VQFRWADGLANPYLTFSAMVMAGLDGIRHQIDPGAPGEGDLSRPEPAMERGGRATPRRLEEALEALDGDRTYLLEGDVFSEQLIDTWMALKEREISAIRRRPHPHELSLHLDG
jgi:glutamine synthetase